MADRSVVVRLMANIADFKAQMQQAERSVKGVGDESEKTSQQATTSLGRLTESAQKNEKAWNTAGTALTAFGAVTTLALGATIKAAIDWESAWAGVTKTVDGSKSQMAELETGLRGLARTLPATHGEIAAVAEAAGQLGVKREGIVAFTRTMVDLGETTNLTSEEAATSLAQLMNVMQTAPEDVGRLGAALVALGNDGASTEADIVNLASYITGSAKLIGASESDVLALANAMTSMGINAERGGGVMTRVMQDVYAAVQTGGDKLEGFAKVAGTSSADFAKAFREDPIRAIDSFVQGLNGVESSGGNVIETLSELGYKGTQDTAVLLQLKGAGDLLTDSLDLGNEAWKENTALVDEAAKRYDTTAAKLAIARNGINDAAIEIGGVFLPVLADLAGGLADVAGWFADLPGPIQGTIGGLAGVAGVGALAGGAFLLLFPRVIDTVQAFKTLNTTNPGVASGLGKVGKAAGVAGAAFVTLQTITSAFGESAADLDRFAARAQALGGPAVEGQIKSLTDEIARQQAIVEEAAISWEILGIGIFSNDDAKTAADRIDALNERLAQLQHQKELDAIASGQAAAGAQGMADATNAAGTAVANIGPSIESTYGSIEGYAAALGLSEDATADLITKTSELGTSLGDFINPLGAYTGLLEEKKEADRKAAEATAAATESSTDSWEDFVTDVGFSFDEYMQRLRDQVTAQENWQTNMLILAGRVSEGTLAELARMGPEGAPLVADLVTKSDDILDEFDVITAARAKEATDAWGAQLTMAGPVLTALAGMAGQGVADEMARKLQAGTITLAEIAQQWGISIVNGVNPVLAGLGKPRIDAYGIVRAPNFVGPVQWNKADGGVMDFYANGGVEDHVAQFAKPGDWRVWAEPETGGEAYIPLHPGKRTRSVDIWRQVGDRLGVQFQEFAFGGINDVPKPPSTAPFQPPLSTAADAAMQKAYDEVTAWLTANLEPTESPSSSSGLGPRAAAARQHVMDTWGITNIGGFAKRNIYGTSTPSKHSMGKAIDVMTSNLRIGWEIANFFNGPGRGQFGVDNVIWQQSIAGRGGGPFRRMADRGSPTQNHMDHPHIDFLKKGGILNPHVRDTGGPLLPGYTFNGTGGNEMVVPRHITDSGGGGAMAVAVSAGPTVVHVTLDGRELRHVARVEAQGVMGANDAELARNARSAF